jgi:hypothetical protein
MKKVLAGLALLVAVSVAAPSTAQAQCDISLWTCVDGHLAPVSGGSYGGSHHLWCEICMGPDHEEPMTWCHQCESHLTTEQQQAFVAITTAARKGDLDEVLRLAPKGGDRVTYNEARRAVQVVSCRGTEVVSSLPLITGAQIRLAVLLPREFLAPPNRAVAGTDGVRK